MRSLMLPRSLILPSSLLLAFGWSSAHGQIVKCTDTSGHVTYQQAPCAAGQQGQAIDLAPGVTPVDAATWEAAADAGHVVPRMPKRWVLRARGTPPDIRAATPAEQATEIWRYPQTTTVLTIGFTGDAVAWVRDEPRFAAAPAVTPAPAAATASAAALAAAPAAATAPAPAAAAPVAAGNRRNAENLSSIVLGRTCDSVLAVMGPPDRKESVQISAATLGGPDILAAATKYIYEAGADRNERTAFTCLGGKVADVERAGGR